MQRFRNVLALCWSDRFPSLQASLICYIIYNVHRILPGLKKKLKFGQSNKNDFAL